jgi:hypothetical protein
MDSTHYRFYDWNTPYQLVSNPGYQIVSRKSDGNFPLSRFLGPLRRVADSSVVSISLGLFGYWFIITAQRRY